MARFPHFVRDVRIGRALGLTTEQLYDLPEQEYAVQVAEWEAAEALCHCGNPREKCSDPGVLWYPQRTVCYATMAQMAAQREWEALHEKRPWHNGQFERWAEKRSPKTPHHMNDAVTIFASDEDHGLGGDFLGREKS